MKPLTAIVLTISALTLLVVELGGFHSSDAGRLPVGNGIPAIALAERHGLILASDGSLWCWGSDFLGWPVLGLGSNTLKSTSLRRIGLDSNWVNISAGTDHNLAIKSDGSLWTWGEAVPFSQTAIYTPVLAAPGNDWKQAAAGGSISIGLKSNGTLWAWGNSWSGSAGNGTTNRNISRPVRIGSSTNWVKVWAGTAETLALQSDGSLWYWGENPDPSFAQGAGQILSPTRVGADTNWIDIGFANNTVLGVKSDGTLWTWGRNADRYTHATDFTQDATPTRIGTNSDWQNICATANWWCNGLIKKDGSLWFLDASEGKPNGPRTPYQPIEFRQAPYTNDYVAYAAGATHAEPAGVHGPIGVILKRNGEVWTWGMVLGDPPNIRHHSKMISAAILRRLFPRSGIIDPELDPEYSTQPWQLRVDGE
jgi:alpha-tubulin suppressor-like RCC1 family protein